MSILRNAFDQNIVDQEQANFLQEQADAQGMGALRRGWNAGRVGGDLNAALIDEAGALAAGDAQKAALLGQQREHLEQRQRLYAPDVAKVEDIKGVGDALSWAGTQIGQGVASSADPVALSAAGSALGRLPGVFKLAPLAAGVGALALNQRQLAGEHVGRLREDPIAMANLGAQGVYDQANTVGLAGAALDTVPQFMIGRALGGAALRKGASGMMGRSFGGKMATGMLGEGATEVGQGEIGRYAHGQANAARDTSGDWSDRLNEFAGGAVGGAPLSAAGAAADMAYGGTAQAGEVVKDKAGTVLDMTAEKAKQAYEDSGIKGAVDLGVEGTKSVYEKVAEFGSKVKDYARDASGKINYAETYKRAKADIDRYKMSEEEFVLLAGVMPRDLSPDQQVEWVNQNFDQRSEHVFNKLSALEQEGVAEATPLIDRMTSDDPLDRTRAVDEASNFLLERNAAARVRERSALYQVAFGGFIQKTARRFTRGAKAVGDAAVFTGVNAAEGVRQGLSKKNMQGAGVEGDSLAETRRLSDPQQLDYDTWKRMREEGGAWAGQGTLFGTPHAARTEFSEGKQKHAIARATEAFERGGEKPIKTDPEAAARSLERATLFAEIMAAETQARTLRTNSYPGVGKDGDVSDFARYVAFEIADMADAWGSRAGQTARPTARDKAQAEVSISLLDSMADDIIGLMGDAGSDVISRMAQQAPPESQPFFELLQDRVQNWKVNAPERAAREQNVRDQMVALLPQQFQADLLKDKGAGARQLYDAVGAIARGLVGPTKRAEIEKFVPRETLNQMLTLYGSTVPDKGGTGVSGWASGDDSEAFDADRLSVDDDGEVVEGASDFEKNMGEKALSRGGVGQKRYGHSKSPSMREDPFAPAKRMSKEERLAFLELDRERRAAGEPGVVYPEVERPELFTKGQKNFDGSDAVEQRIEAMSEKLGPDFSVTARSAQDVMDANKTHPASRLAIFRDYMSALERDESQPEGVRAVARSRMKRAQAALLDALDDPESMSGLRRNKVDMTDAQQEPSGFSKPGPVEQWVEGLLQDYEAKGGVRQDKKEIKDEPPPRLTAGQRKELYAAMENYFRSRYIVEAERQIDRESSKIDAVEIRKMIESGRKGYDVMRKEHGDGTDALNAAASESNLLWFESTLHDERTSKKAGYVPISANALVGWVRKQRSLSEEYSGNDEGLSNRDKNDAFLSDLYEGISILMNSGFMTGKMPHLIGPDGKKQSFADGVPANLLLETTTGKGHAFARDERIKKVPKGRHERRGEDDSADARDDERYQRARDWELAQGDDLSDGGGNAATQIEVGEEERETMNPYGGIKRKALKASSSAYEKRLGVEQQMRELGVALQNAQGKGSAVQIAALSRRINELAVIADGLPTEPPDTIEEIESRLEATHAELIAAMAVGGGDAKRIAKLGEEAAAKKRWVAPLELRGQATSASVMKQRVASLEDQRREERAPGEKISALKRRVFELATLLDIELNKERKKAPPGTPGAPKRTRAQTLAKETLDAGDRGGIDAAYTRGGRVGALNEMQRQDNAASEAETPEERMAREAGLLGWLDDAGAQENETPTQRRARLRTARRLGLLGEAYEQGGKRAHSGELERQDTQRAAGLRNNRIDSWRVDQDNKEHAIAAAKRAAADEGLEFGSAEYREFVRSYTKQRSTDRSRDSEQVLAEKTDLSMRSKQVGSGLGPEPKTTAKRFAEDRAGAILETFRREGIDKGMEVLERRLRTAKEKNTDPSKGTVGGAHYAWPLVHILNPWQMSMVDLAAGDPALNRLAAMRSELAMIIHDARDISMPDKVAMVKAMASEEGAERVNATNVMTMLAGASKQAREAAAAKNAKTTPKAAPEVAATEAPKSQPKPGGAVKAVERGALETLRARRPDKQFAMPNDAQLSTINAIVAGLPEALREAAAAFGFVIERGKNRGMTYTGAKAVGIDVGAIRDDTRWAAGMTPRERMGWVVAHELGHAADADKGFALSLGYPESLMAEARAATGKNPMLDWVLDYPLNSGVKSPAREMVAQLAALHAFKPEILNEHLPKNAAWIRRALGTDQADGADANVAAGVGVGARRDGRNARDDGPVVPGRQAEPKAERKVGFTLTPADPYTPTEQVKASKANVFVGRGSKGSPTATYAQDAKKQGIPVNPGTYSADDIVYISAETEHDDSLEPDFAEIDKVMEAGATILTNPKSKFGRTHSTGDVEVLKFLRDFGYEEHAPGEWGPRKRKLSLQGTTTDQAPVRQLNKRLVGLLAERGIKVEESALDHVPPEMRVSLVNRTLMADLKEPLAEDVAKFISWMTVDSDMYQKIADGIAGTALEKAILSEVNRDARQSMYTPVRKQREVVRRAVERLLTNGLMKKHAAEAPLPLRVVQMVRSAIKGIMEALGGVKYKDLQGLADQYVDDLLSGKITLERPRKPGTVRVDPYEAFKVDQHAADLTFALTDGGGFALTGSLAYASQGSVYRPAGATIHDLDFTTSLTQRAAEQRLERLYPQAHKVRSFGGLGDFVSTYVVPPKGHRADLVVMEGGAVRAFVVRDASGKIVGRYTNNDKGEISTGVKGTVVDLIGDKRGAAGKLTAPTTFGDKQIPIADVAHAMAQKLMYARDKDIIDFANFVPNGRGRKLNAQGTVDPQREALIDEFMNSPGGEAMGFDPTDRDAREEVRGMFDRGELSSTPQGKAWAKLGEVPSDEQLLGDLPETPADTQGDVGVDEDAGLLLDSEPEAPTEAQTETQNSPEEPPKPAGDTQGATEAKKRATAGVATDEEIKLARAYFEKVLGKQIRAEFRAITGYSGEWIEAENLITISTLTGAGTMNVARHEALHAFWSRFVKNNPKALRVLTSLTDDPRILQRLQVLLKDEPAALAQLTDGEERLAYIYQFAMAGLLKLPHRPGTTLMHKVRKFLRRAFQMISDQERAVDLLYAFEHGKLREPSAAGRVVAKTLAQGTALKRGIRAIDGLAQWTAAQVLPANTILSESPSATVRVMAAMFYTNPGEEGAADGGQGYLNARNEKMRSFSNLFRAAIDGLDKPQLDALTEAMQLETPTRDIADPDVAEAKEELNALFARFHKYLTQEKGLRIGEIKKDYFPVVYNPEAVRSKGLDKLLLGKYRANIDAMVEAINTKVIEANNRLLEDEDSDLGEMREMATAENVVEAIINHITRDNPTDDAEMEPKRQDGVLRPWFGAGERRVLSFLSPEDRAPFQEKDIVTTLSRYVRQGVRAAEYSSRFGRQGKVLARMLSKAEAELVEVSRQMLKEGELKNEKARKKWAERQYRDVARAVGAMEGSLGHDVGEFVRKANSAAVVYQNIRLLPLALFSSFVDPLGIIARGGEMRLAYEAFTRGLRGVVRQWGDMLHDESAGRGIDKWEKLAELAGVIDSATFSHLLTDEYGSVYMDSRATKINEIMFKANGMEAWNRGMRVGATKAAVAFMVRHNQGKDEHSARWMRDLGFEVGHLLVDEDGNMLTDKREVVRAKPKWTMEEAEAYVAKTHAAINRWVESAIMSPNAAQRPAWGSDPHYGMFWHLKQFAYSFHTTMIKRAINEASYGNYSPLGVFAWYIPTMIASDIVKNLALGAGELPAYMKSYDLGDWVLHGVNRSGALGVGHLAIEGVQDPASLAGPMVEQVKDIYVQPAKESIIEALPANALYGRWLK